MMLCLSEHFLISSQANAEAIFEISREIAPNHAHRFSNHEQSKSIPNASSDALTICSYCFASDGRVIAKEPQHFPSRVWPSRIGVGAGGTAARPSVASSMDAPLL
jgi:hypothetical protein